jgi:hypothetical protein
MKCGVNVGLMWGCEVKIRIFNFINFQKIFFKIFIGFTFLTSNLTFNLTFYLLTIKL